MNAQSISLPAELEGLVPDSVIRLSEFGPSRLIREDDEALILYFLASKGILDLPEEVYIAVRGQCGTLVDSNEGGLSLDGHVRFGSDKRLVAIAKWHREQRALTAVDRSEMADAAPSAAMDSAVSANPHHPGDLPDSEQAPHHVSLEKLTPHPRNVEIYSEDLAADSALMEDIHQHGLLEPLVITQDYIVLSGHRRLRACRDLGLKAIRVVTRQVCPEEEVELLLAYNAHRDKSNIEKAREFIALREIEAVKAEARQKRGIPVENSAQGPEKGSTRDLAARPLGWCGRTAELAAKVVEEIDRHRKDGTPAGEIEAVVGAFNKSIRAGYQAAERHSWFPHSPKGSAKPSSNPEEAAPLLTAMDAAAATLANTPAAHNLFKRTRASLGKGLQSLPERDRSEALRYYARALLDLADKLDTQPPAE